MKLAFEMKGKTLPLEKIHRLRIIDPKIRKSAKYKVIAASIKEVGVIEPPVVYSENRKNGTWALLDGHLRLDVLSELGVKEVFCLISTVDDPYTYNKMYNGLSTIQENKMIRKVVEYGVPEERISKVLAVNLKNIHSHRRLLDGICSDAVEVLKDRAISHRALRLFKRVKPFRQTEMAELMVMADDYSFTYAQALFAGTPKEQLADPEKEKKLAGLKPEEIARMEREMDQLEKSFRLYKDAFRDNHFHLVLAGTYLKKLLVNGAIVRYLAKNHADMLAEFQKISDAASLEG